MIGTKVLWGFDFLGFPQDFWDKEFGKKTEVMARVVNEGFRSGSVV